MSEVQTAPGQISILKSERKWLGEHAEYRNGQWYCKKTKKEILMVEATHTVWENDPGPCAGSGTKTVFHLYCPGCSKEPEFKFGSPVQADDLMDARNG